MRPIKLVIQAYGAYPNRVEIPFSKLNDDSLYLVSGVTGSGKTTIFDAISFALFNTPSGSIRTNTQLRSHYAKDDVLSFVEFTFLFNGEKYVVHRSPMYERKKMRGEGYIQENAKAQLTLPDNKLIIGVKEVDEYIVNLLGINKSEFSQIALLAQGEFRKLLNSDTQTRGDIFRNIFKTQDYSRFSLMLKNKTSELRDTYETLKKSILQYLSQVQSNSVEINETIELYASNNCITNFPSFLELLKKEMNEDNDILKSREVEQKKLDKENRDIEQTIKNIEDKNQIEKSLKNIEDDIKNATLNFKNSEEKYLKLDDKNREVDSIKLDIENKKTLFKKAIELKENKKLYDELNKKNLSLNTSVLNYKNDYLKFLYLKYLSYEDKLKDTQRIFENKQKEFLELQNDYNIKNMKYLSMQAGILAKDLKDNLPCPVCGSLSHPNPAKISTEEISLEIIKALKNEVESKNKILNSLSEKCASINLEKQSSIEKFNETKKYFLIDFDETAISFETNVPSKDYHNLISNLNDVIQNNTLEIAKIKNQIDIISKELDYKNISQIEEENAKLNKKLDDLISEIDVISKNYQNSNLTLQNLLSKKDMLLEQKNKYSNISSSCNDLKELFNENKTKLENLNKIISDTSFKLQTNKNLFENLTNSSKKFHDVEKNYNEYKVLSDLANGTLKGKPRIPFEQYIQGYYLDMVLFEANKHLKVMTKNQYQLIRKKDTSSHQSKTGLDIEVMDFYTYKKRNTNTLSGGESFKAALSLALGLSDVVSSLSGAINIESMFIDEGFGTLDTESLELAMDVIIKLSQNGRLIGVISHVDELKNRIQNVITTIKTNEGSKVQMNF